MALLFGDPIINKLHHPRKNTATLAQKFNLILELTNPPQSYSPQTIKMIQRRNAILTSLAKEMERAENYGKTIGSLTSWLRKMGRFGVSLQACTLDTTVENIINASLAIYLKSGVRVLKAGSYLPPFAVPFTSAGTHCLEIRLPNDRRANKAKDLKISTDRIFNAFDDTAFLGSSSSLIEMLTFTFPQKLGTVTSDTSKQADINFEDLDTHIKFVTTLALICRLHHENTTDDPDATLLFMHVIKDILTHIEIIYPHRHTYPEQYLLLIRA
ncbi:hypothetical protein CAPTEDRAFT_202481, partial [Capitella teleta]